MIFRIMKEVLLAKSGGVKFEPNLKGWSKTGTKFIIDMDSQEAHIIADTVELGISTLTEWLIFNNHMKVKELPLVCIYADETCIA